MSRKRKLASDKTATLAIHHSESTDELSGAEHFLVGVSPQYWAHTPMSIATLENLGLVDGVDCIVVKKKNHQARFIPVSKCELHGVIVNAERRSNGSCLYLLDDGTGVVDCLSWVDNAMYSLPSLVPDDNNEQGRDRIFRVGDVVQVFGKIKCVSIGGIRESIKVHGREWKVQDCVREVHITSMSALPLNAQSNHWLRCMQFDRRADTPTGSYLDPVRNGSDVIRLLGPEIASKAVQRTNFPARDDAYGAWRVFGAGCKCKLPYLDSLLYCHCQATVVALDPYFKFRDAVLNLLVQMEDDVTKRSTNTAQSKESHQLRFQYKTIVRNTELQKVAKGVVVNGSSAIAVDRLFLQTFAALRKDGIVALLDHEADIYLLISRQGVLGPHCKMLLERTSSTFLERRVLQNEQPRYLRNVSNARLQYVKKMITDNR